MSDNTCCSARMRKVMASFVGVLGSFLIIGALAWLVVGRGEGEVDAAAAKNRLAVREKLEQEAKADLARFAIDGSKENLARLSIDRAMDVLVAEWGKDAGQGRAKLLERLEASKKTQSFE
jgi:hypothetical protein